jgi:hypothetical protein
MPNEANEIEPAYLITEEAPGKWKVFKVDLGAMTVIKEHEVSNGRCDCEGWKHNAKCRHLQMVFNMLPTVTRAAARKAASEVIEAWQGFFERIIFDDYVFDGPEEEGVRLVKLRARGQSVGVEGVDKKPHRRLLAVRKGVFVEVKIE